MLRIPTKSLESLKRLFLVFMIEIVPKGKGGLKFGKDHQLDITKLEFKGDYFAVVPLYSSLTESIISDDAHNRVLYHVGSDKNKFNKIRADTYNESFKKKDNCFLKLDVKVVSSEFTQNRFINNLISLLPKKTVTEKFNDIIEKVKEIGS